MDSARDPGKSHRYWMLGLPHVIPWPQWVQDNHADNMMRWLFKAPGTICWCRATYNPGFVCSHFNVSMSQRRPVFSCSGASQPLQMFVFTSPPTLFLLSILVADLAWQPIASSLTRNIPFTQRTAPSHPQIPSSSLLLAPCTMTALFEGTWRHHTALPLHF